MVPKKQRLLYWLALSTKLNCTCTEINSFLIIITYTFVVAVYEQDSEPAIIADKMTRLLSEAEPPLKATQDQEVTTHYHHHHHFIEIQIL